MDSAFSALADPPRRSELRAPYNFWRRCAVGLDRGLLVHHPAPVSRSPRRQSRGRSAAPARADLHCVWSNDVKVEGGSTSRGRSSRCRARAASPSSMTSSATARTASSTAT